MNTTDFDQVLEDFDAFSDLPALESAHLLDKLIQAHGHLSEVVDHLTRDSWDPELQGMIKAAEQLTDFLIITFQQRMPHD
jgi:hypothetical protein